VRVLFIRFVKALFSAAPEGHYKFHAEEDEKSTEIVIRDETPIDVRTIGKRPAVNFTMGPVQFYGMGLDDLLGYDASIDRKTKGMLVPGTVTINVSSRVDVEAYNLAWVIGEHLWLLRDELMKQGFFELGRSIGIGSPSSPSSVIANDMNDEWTVVSVSVPYQFPRKSARTPLGKEIVKSIETAISMNPPQLVNAQGPQSAGHEYPFTVHECAPPAYAPNASDVYGHTPDPTGTKQRLLPKIPHPLNPAVTVTVRSARPYGPAVKPPSVRGRPLPISDPCVEESDS